MSIAAELGLEEMLRDPIVRLVMRRDGVKASDVRAMMKRIGGGALARTRSGRG